MSQRILPALEVGTSYRVVDFERFEYQHRSLGQAHGEEANILRLHLKNQTILDLPVSDEAFEHLLRTMIHMFPAVALDEIKRQPWSKADFPDANG
ncbi:hypothetical protein ACQKKX_02435 [Neorhizobium sp. NPDC001467]|uniref:hypothetical protein n=1 Tax=Neorhizobium sp. NPDC001467 TaxID=3390595 RepID=UPI003CFE4714